jgi:hypothetical protein
LAPSNAQQSPEIQRVSVLFTAAQEASAIKEPLDIVPLADWKATFSTNDAKGNANNHAKNDMNVLR